VQKYKNVSLLHLSGKVGSFVQLFEVKMRSNLIWSSISRQILGPLTLRQHCRCERFTLGRKNFVNLHVCGVVTV